ncbi:MAG: hypothetical protein AAGI34_07405 [Pseudomonadota bacterium]
MSQTLYADRRFTVTLADIRTPTAYYPVADTVGRIRRDPLIAGLAYAVLMGIALWVYADLWHAQEVWLMAGSIVLALLAGSQLAILQLDARGFPARLFLARTATVRAVFAAIGEARTLQESVVEMGRPGVDDDIHPH